MTAVAPLGVWVTGTECLSALVPSVPSTQTRTRPAHRAPLRPLVTWRLLELLTRDGDRSQRELSIELRAALGHTNHLLQTVVTAGWVRMVQGQGHRLRYELTRDGQVERRRLARRHLQQCGDAYVELREHVTTRLGELIVHLGSAPEETRLVLYGEHDLAEVGYLCARRLGATVVGTIDERGGATRWNVPCHGPDALDREQLAGEPFDCVVIMSFDRVERIRTALRARRVPQGRIAAL